MPANFLGLRVISFESRRAAEMRALIERHGGVAISAPSMRENPNPSHDEAFAFAEALFAGRIDAVILLTGVGTRMLIETLTGTTAPVAAGAALAPATAGGGSGRACDRDELLAALAKVPLICRGPKPVAVLREFGLKPAIEVPEPNTWQDLLKTLDARWPVTGKCVAVQEYGVTNQRLLDGLSQRGALVMRVPVYQWALPLDLAPLRAAIDAIIAEQADVAMFTSATQVFHLFEVAKKDGKALHLVDAFRFALIASIGPVASETIVEHGLKPDYEPDSPHMASLVRETARRSRDLLEKKRTAARHSIDTNHWKRVDMRWPGVPSPLTEGVAESARPDEGGAHDHGATQRDGAISVAAGSDPHPSPLPKRERGPEQSTVANLQSEISSPNSEISNPKSEIRNPESSVFLQACRREPVPYTPIWLMRQAGRYQREYRDVRAGVSMLELCRSSELCAEVTLMAVDRLGVDAAIIFSDILTVVEPLGFSLDFVKGDGPVIHNPYRERSDVARLRSADAAELGYVYEAIAKTRRALRPDIALIGFCGAPFTVASYIIEGGKSKEYALTKTMMRRDAVSWHALMDKLVDLEIGYLRGQIDAGADAVQIFDSWVGSLSPDDFREHVMPHVKRLIEGVRSQETGIRRQDQGTEARRHEGPKGPSNPQSAIRNPQSPSNPKSEIRNPKSPVPIIYFGTGNASLLPLMKECGCDVVGIDWRVDLADTWRSLGHDTAIMGNLDPTVLYCSPTEIRAQAKRILDKAANRPGHIFNLGHGILPDMSPENVTELVDAVHEMSQR